MVVRGVPLGCRTRPGLEALIKSFGTIRRVISKGLIEGEPNIVLVEGEDPMGSTPPATMRLRGAQGTFGIWLSTRVPPPPPATHLKLAAAEDGQEKDRKVSEAELTANESSRQQKQRTSPTTMELQGKQQPLEEIEGQMSLNTQEMTPRSEQNSLEKDGDEESSKSAKQRPERTKRGGIQHEGLLYERKKVIFKPDRGLMAWMKEGKCARMQLAAGS